ncbi:hypothetical protein CC80DRAFT_554361 [Byssothecium circinans]|uniref:Uncharacterized protein n=1 Tax=Byssothecium circinans TaxID=147558 RepID=A0A6A5TDJ7_9PLEO|nr:hypothetical protein CC80DRAFT_554361 [Byssothecium circinans]
MDRNFRLQFDATTTNRSPLTPAAPSKFFIQYTAAMPNTVWDDHGKMWNVDALYAVDRVGNAIQDMASTYTLKLQARTIHESVKAKILEKQAKTAKIFNKNHPALVKLGTSLKCFDKLIALDNEHLTFLQSHSAKFRAGLKGRWDPDALLKYVSDDATVYMARTTELNSQIIMAMKPIDPQLMEESLKAGIEKRKVTNPGLAERMAKWDTDQSTADGKGKKA